VALGAWFGLYLIGSIAVVLVLDALSGIRIGWMTATLLTPWMGVEERLNIFDYMIATVVQRTGVRWTAARSFWGQSV
jgi:hypothetical protein